MTDRVIWRVEELKRSRLLDDRGHVVVLTDEHTALHCLPYFVDNWLGDHAFHHVSIDAGETHKNLDVVQTIYDALLHLEVDRQGLLIALGGGVVTDIGGFAAATYKRGIDLINVPTTHLAMVDAAIGGKNGVNLGELKNQVGTFHPPKATLIDTAFLRTLDHRQLRSGWMETVKHALISDNELWQKIRHGNAEGLMTDAAIIHQSIKVKQSIAAEDTQDLGVRQSLNFGHTIGHAIEVDSQLLHGEAVALGTIAELWLSNQCTGLSAPLMHEAIDYICALEYPIQNVAIQPSTMLERMKHDKKNHSGEMRFALISDIGRAEVGIGVSPDLIKESLDFAQRIVAP